LLFSSWSFKSLNNSPNGDPGGNCGKGDDCVLIVWVVEILTTDGVNF